MASSKNTLVQRIALDGGDEIKRELLALGKAGEQAFKALERQAKASKSASTGLNADILRLRTSMVALGRSVQQVGRNFSFLGGAVGQFAGVLATAFSAQAFVDITTAWTDLNSRIKLATGSAEEGAATMQRLAEIARRTYSPLQTTAEVFADNALVLNDLGISTQKQLDLQESLNNALVVSGSRGDRARRVQEAFTKAMGLGVLRGDELNAILEAGGRVAQLLAQHFGVTSGELRKLGEQGLITSKVFQDVLLENMGTLRREAEEMPATISDGFILIQNALLTYIGTADQGAGVSSAIAAALISIADNIHIVVPALLTLAGLFLLIKGINLAKDLLGVASVLIKDVLPAIIKVTLALARNPFGLAAVVIAALLVALIQATGGFENFGRIVTAVAAEVYAAVEPLVKPVLDFLAAVGGAIKAFAVWIGLVEGDSAKAADAAAEVDAVIQDTSDSLGDAGADGTTAGRDISKGFDRAGASVDSATGSVDGLSDSLSEALATAKALAAEMAKLGSGGGGTSGGDNGFSLDTPAYSGGGSVRGRGTGTSDSIFARLSNGEFVMKAKAVRKWGVGMLNRLNRGLPAFASGGLVTGLPGFSSAPAFAGGAAMGGASGRPLTLVLDGETFSGLSAPEDVAGKLVSFAAGRKVRSAGKKPGWYGA